MKIRYPTNVGVWARGGKLFTHEETRPLKTFSVRNIAWYLSDVMVWGESYEG
jgi:hypothetical protein